jgi:multiple antibiotic resistance protein
MNIEFYKTAFLTMFVALDPPGLAPVFITLTAHMAAHERKATAIRATIIAFSILAGAAICGQPLLHSLGIGIPAFRIAGGLLLFWIAVEMVFERREERKAHSAEVTVAHDHFHSIAAFPLAIPLMAGPGAITATILQASIAQHSVLDFSVLIGILLVVTTSCLGVFLMAGRIDRWLGQTGRVVLSRLLGVLLASMAVQTVGDGIISFAK